ncbi:MAG TPA: nodulation protein NfeD [Myxococcales bacterium]|nr:nodulation protein NfeD [Myxococcales bacterium]HIN84901.1 nodulation protein NfeD [Myxococcales bacterium]
MFKRSKLRLLFASILVLGGFASSMADQRRPPESETRTSPHTKTDSEAEKAPVTAPSCQKRAISFDGGAGKRIILVNVHETIDLGLSPHIERVLAEAAQSEDVALVLLHMNTPGGRLDAAQNIKDALLKSKIPTATFIDTHALSAGALIAYATDFIVVNSGATMGAATPIQMGQSGEAKGVGEKFVSAVRAIFESTAQAKQRDGKIAEAMVDKDVEIPGLIKKGKLLTLSKDDALKFCVADFEASDVDDLKEKLNLGQAKVVQRQLNWAEKIARVLTDPTVSSLLMTFGFLGLMMELYTAGFGITGFIGISCLLVFFTGHMIVNLAGAEELLLFVAGCGLLAVEIFVIPGFGLAGVLGIGALLASVVLAMVGQDISFSWEIGFFGDAMERTGWAFISTLLLFAVAAKFLPKTKLFQKLVLNAAVFGGSHDLGPSQDLQGAKGVAHTDIRGSGKARINGRTVDVVTQGDYINKGDALVVLESRPGQIVVEPDSSEST